MWIFVEVWPYSNIKEEFHHKAWTVSASVPLPPLPGQPASALEPSIDKVPVVLGIPWYFSLSCFVVNWGDVVATGDGEGCCAKMLMGWVSTSSGRTPGAILMVGFLVTPVPMLKFHVYKHKKRNKSSIHRLDLAFQIWLVYISPFFLRDYMNKYQGTWTGFDYILYIALYIYIPIQYKVTSRQENMLEEYRLRDAL